VEDLRLTAPPPDADAAVEAPSPLPPPPPGPPDPRLPTWRAVLRLAGPTFLQQMLILSVSLSDRFLAGRFQAPTPVEHDAAQSAMTTAHYVYWVITSYIVLVSVGATALVGRFIGAGDREGASAAANQAVLLGAAVGLFGAAAGLLGMPALLELLQLRGAAARYAWDFLRPLLALLPFQVVEMACIASLAGAGDTRSGLKILGSVAVLNLSLAWLFFYGAGPLPALGLPGIALGTAVSHTLGCLAALVVLAWGRAGLRLRWRLLGPRWDLQGRLLRVSVPAALDSLSVAAAQLWFLSIVNRLGDVAGGASGIAIVWEGLGYYSGSAFATAAMALVSQNLGAGRPQQAARSGWTAFLLGGALMSLMGATFFTLAPVMFGLFCPGPDQAPIVEAGVPVLQLVAFAMPPLASCIIFTGALRGAGDRFVPVLFSWAGFLAVRIPLAYLLTGPAGLGLLGAWLAMFADILLRGGFFLARFAGGRWQRMRV
jgi:putative MATE family efflux protein